MRRNNSKEYLIESMDFFLLNTRINQDVFNLIFDKNNSKKNLIEIINRDHSLASRILALANSPVYGFSKKISTIELAVSILGSSTVKDLIVGFSIINSTVKDNDRYFISDAFNKHAYLCGYICQLLANDFNYQVKNEAFVAGLLHDIGIAIIHRYLNDEFKLINELKFYKKINQTRAEKLILGKTHCDIGAEVAVKWNLPDSLVDAIKYHHNPDESVENKKLVAIVHLADFIVTKETPQFLLISEDEPINKSVLEILNIPDESYLYDILNNISELVRTVNII